LVFSKLSKVLNQEDALGAPCLGCDFDFHGPSYLLDRFFSAQSQDAGGIHPALHPFAWDA
jgi:hypothetical protein